MISLNKIIDNKSTKDKISIPYETILEKDIDEIYNKFKSNIAKDDFENNKNEINIPQNVRKILDMQENTLNQIKIKEKYSDSLNKYLAKKSNKKEEDLLIKKIDYLRMRKEFNELTSNQNSSIGGIPPEGNWIMNLRSQKNSMFPEITYLNYGEGTNPYYVPIRERRNKSIDVIRDPNSTSKLDIRLINSNRELMENRLSINDKSINSSTLNFIQSLNSQINSSNIEDMNVSFKKTTNENTGINIIGHKKCPSNLIVIE